MLRKSAVALVLAVAWASFAGRGRADGFSVYAHQMPDGDFGDGRTWERSPFQNDVFTTLDACWQSVVDRILTNWQNDSDTQGFMILWTETRPQWGWFDRPYVEPPYQAVLYYYPIGNQNFYLFLLGTWYGPFSGA